MKTLIKNLLRYFWKGAYSAKQAIESKLSPEDTIKWAELEHESHSVRIEVEHEQAEHHARIWAEVQQIIKFSRKQRQDEARKKKTGTLLIESETGKAMGPAPLPEAGSSEEGAPEHTDGG